MNNHHLDVQWIIIAETQCTLFNTAICTLLYVHGIVGTCIYVLSVPQEH